MNKAIPVGTRVRHKGGIGPDEMVVNEMVQMARYGAWGGTVLRSSGTNFRLRLWKLWERVGS